MMLHRQKIELIGINLVCGGAVLFSYAHGLLNNPAAGDTLWGNVPPWLLPFYTASMLAAAAGYLLFTWYLLFQVNPDGATVARRYRYRLFHVLYGIVLVPSALWMPLTFAMLRDPSYGLWIAIRFVLAVVGSGSVGICAAMALLRPRYGGAAFVAAMAGAIIFCFQTAILDALVWPAFFPLTR